MVLISKCVFVCVCEQKEETQGEMFNIPFGVEAAKKSCLAGMVKERDRETH